MHVVIIAKREGWCSTPTARRGRQVGPDGSHISDQTFRILPSSFFHPFLFGFSFLTIFAVGGSASVRSLVPFVSAKCGIFRRTDGIKRKKKEKERKKIQKEGENSPSAH